MKKSLFLTCLLAVAGILGVSAKDTWPITLTTADGLPGEKIVRNYVYQSRVFDLDEAVTTLRFTVVSTNTVDTLTTGSYDGMSAGWGPGFPFFTMSEFRILDANGNEVGYTASSNATATNDGGGLDALSDNNESTYFHGTYTQGDLEQRYQYLEFELDAPVSSFSFRWNTRSDYHKNLITYLGITPGDEYLPYPEQEFQLGEQVTSLEDLGKEGALFLIQGNAIDIQYNPNENINRPYVGKTYFHSPYGGHVVPNAASLVYLIPTETENAYKVCWLNNGHYLIKAELNGGWYQWTNDELKAGNIEFAPCDTVDGNFRLSLNDAAYLISADPIGKMSLVENTDEAKGNRARPNAYTWTIWNASIKGSAIIEQLKEQIELAEARIAAVGGKIEGEDTGQYDALVAAIDEAKALVAKSDVTAAEVVAAKRNLNLLTADYAAVGIWAYIDSIEKIYEAVDAEEILISSSPDWIQGSYNKESYDNLQIVSDEAQVVIEAYQSLADIDAAIAKIYAAIDNFWASKINNVKTLPFRVGTTEDGLPGTLQSYGGYKWESPIYNLTKTVDALRFTIIKTNNNAQYLGYVFPTFAEIELYDGAGNKIALTEDNFTVNSLCTTDGGGIAALCDNNTGTHYHAAWSAGTDHVGYTDNPDYCYIEISLPEPVSTFQYIQYGRKNGVNTPTDFIITEGGVEGEPDEVPLVDFYNTTLGEKVTDASQITDDGLYAIQGLYSCDPVDYLTDAGLQEPRFFTATVPYGKTLGAPAVYSIRGTGEDGTYYIQSLADGGYWQSTSDADGWGGGLKTTADRSIAAKVHIVPCGNDDLPNSFVLYEYKDSLFRDVDGESNVHVPYLVFQDWGDELASFSVPNLERNDKDGEGEWYIYKVTMDTPYCYWLKNLVATAESMNITVSNDPGYYTGDVADVFAKALATAQEAVETNNDAVAKDIIFTLEDAIINATNSEVNPMTEGLYVIESALEGFYNKQGENKVICAYFNDYETTGPESEYSLWWTSAPSEYSENMNALFLFKFISAKESETVKGWLADSLITVEQAENAYYIQNVGCEGYVGISNAVSQDIGFTDAPEYPYIVRSQGQYKFDIWHPDYENTAFSFHCESNSNGSGVSGDIIYWSGTADASKWCLRKIDSGTSINNLVKPEGDEIVSTTYYTIDGIASAAPVKGVNIVKVVYANGVVETKKVFVK